ncbi:hypothetical protein HDU84_008499 [Entophlyctis sp. JEL0112]|nr:hypothetical protein HDU84_008499 [Entophlyctis sp. JEL0112]
MNEEQQPLFAVDLTPPPVVWQHTAGARATGAVAVLAGLTGVLGLCVSLHPAFVVPLAVAVLLALPITLLASPDPMLPANRVSIEKTALCVFVFALLLTPFVAFIEWLMAGIPPPEGPAETLLSWILLLSTPAMDAFIFACWRNAANLDWDRAALLRISWMPVVSFLLPFVLRFALEVYLGLMKI